MREEEQLLLSLGITPQDIPVHMIKQYRDKVLAHACERITRFYDENYGLTGASINKLHEVISAVL